MPEPTKYYNLINRLREELGNDVEVESVDNDLTFIIDDKSDKELETKRLTDLTTKLNEENVTGYTIKVYKIEEYSDGISLINKALKAIQDICIADTKLKYSAERNSLAIILNDDSKNPNVLERLNAIRNSVYNCVLKNVTNRKHHIRFLIKKNDIYLHFIIHREGYITINQYSPIISNLEGNIITYLINNEEDKPTVFKREELDMPYETLKSVLKNLEEKQLISVLNFNFTKNEKIQLKGNGSVEIYNNNWFQVILKKTT